jgi:hypothetical protein
MLSEFKVKLEVGECNGFMKSKWFANEQCMIEVDPTESGEIDISFDVELPCTIKIELSGKDLNADTKVNQNGNIIQDKFIKISGMWLARHPIPEFVYMNMCEVETNDSKFKTSYFGFPGTVLIALDEQDPITWHFKHNHYKVS